jgi:hypothetical protein
MKYNVIICKTFPELKAKVEKETNKITYVGSSPAYGWFYIVET